MQAVVCSGFGFPPRLEIKEMQVPCPNPGEALIDVACCGVGFPDLLLLAGKYQIRPPLPFIVGSELAGTVRCHAGGQRSPEPGARVLWLPPTLTGGMAESVAAPASSLIELPATIDFTTAVALASSYATAYHALVQRAQLRAGESLVVLGAAGCVGIAAVEIGKALGAHVIAATSTREKLDIAVDHGARDGFLYGTGGLKGGIMRATKGRGADVVLDVVGGTASEDATRSMASAGRVLIVGFASGSIPALPLNLVLLKNCSVIGVSLGRLAQEDHALYRANLERLFQWHTKGWVRPIVRRFRRLDEYPSALARITSRCHIGKCIVEASSPPTSCSCETGLHDTAG